MNPLTSPGVSVRQPNAASPSTHPAYRALEGGLPALLIVTLAGLTLGYFLWESWAAPALGLGLGEIAFIALPVLGVVAAIALWLEYARYFSARAGITFAKSLRHDAITWAPMLLLWATYIVPPNVATGSRLLVLAAILFAILKVLIAARFNQTVREVLLDFVATRAAIIVIAELAAVIIGQRPGQHVSESSQLLLAVWGRWDAVHYLNIATHGYQGTEMAFFPLYPMMIRALGVLVGNHLVAGLLISNACFFFGLLFLYKLLEREFDRPVARRAIFYVSIFPSAVFFSAVYTESLFFMLTVATFFYLRRRRWLMAGTIGFFAAMTRVEGILLLVPFALEWYSVYRTRLVENIRSLLPAALIGCGLALYMAYLWVVTGDPLFFSHVQAHWNRHLAPPWVSVTNSILAIAHAHSGAAVANQALELSFTALMLAVLIFGWKRLRPSYIAYLALSVLVPMCTSSLMSMPRFALVLFPLFAILARWGDRPWVNNLILAFSLPLLGLFTVLFADWYWVA